jgi:hypothetical protein
MKGQEVALGLVRVDFDSGMVCMHLCEIRGPVISDLVGYLDSMLARDPGHPDGDAKQCYGALCWFRRCRP